MQSQTTFALSFWVNAIRIKNNQVSVNQKHNQLKDIKRKAY